MAAKKKPTPKKGGKKKPNGKKGGAKKASPNPKEPITGTAVVLYIDPLKKNEEEAKAQGKRGRPTKYSDKIAEEILGLLKTGMTLNEVCRYNEHLPAASTVRDWAGDINHPFSAQYVHARKIGYLAMSDDTIEIADDGRNDWIERRDEDGKVIGYVINGEHVQRSRLRIDTRKWMLSKALPKIFGEKAAGDNLAGVNPSDLPGADESVDADTRKMELARKVGFMLAQALAKAKSEKASK